MANQEQEQEVNLSEFSDENSLVASVPLTTHVAAEEIEIDSSLEAPSKKIETPLCKPGAPPCPHREIIALYAKCLPDLPYPRAWEGVRSTHLAARWRWVLSDLKRKGMAYDRDAGLDFFRRMFGYIAKSDFLMGRTKNAWNGCDLPWIVEAGNFLKIIEGKYENQGASG